MVAPYLRNIAQDPRITPEVVRAVTSVESSGRPNAVSKKGALGLMQIMPPTAQDLGINPRDPVQNVEGGTRYLNYLIKETGNLPDALSAYNMGLGAFKKRGLTNPPKETVDYTKKVLALLARHTEDKPAPTVAEAPVNPSDPTPQPDPQAAAAEIPEAPTDGSGGGFGSLPRRSSPGPIAAPPSQFLGKNSPIAMVEALLRDPTALSRGEGRSMAGGGAIKKFLGKFKAPRQDALDTAGKNGEKMLGLPPGNTPMERAEALGFSPEPLYHGTTDPELQVFRKPEASGQSWEPSDLLREAAIWASTDPRVANHRAAMSPKGTAALPQASPGSAVLPLLHRPMKSTIFDLPHNITPYETYQNLDRAFNDSFDTVRMNNYTIPDPKKPSTVLAIKNPNQLRSKFAAFDPARKDEPDLLAGVGLGSGLGAAGLIRGEANEYGSRALEERMPGYAGGGKVKSALRKFLEESKLYTKSLSGADKDVVHNYQSGKFYDIQDKLRDNWGLNSQQADQAYRLDKIIADAPRLNQVLQVHRYAPKNSYPNTDPGYLSTTYSPGALERFLGKTDMDGPELVGHRILSPEGTPMLAPRLDANFIHERELLLPRGGGVERTYTEDDGIPTFMYKRGKYAGGGKVTAEQQRYFDNLPDNIVRAPPQNSFLGALSRGVKRVDEFTQPAYDIPYAGWLTPRFESLGDVLEEASYGMPLTTGSGMTTGLKPDVAFAALDASQVPGIVKMTRPIARTAKSLAGKLPRKRETDIAEALFGSEKEWLPAKAAWDKAHGYAKGGAIRGALSRIAKMMGPDEVPKGLQPLQAVKEQGGQWLPGSSQEFVKRGVDDRLLRRLEGVKDVPAHEQWAEKQLPKYIEKYMGAKGDPLADVLIPHGQGTKRWEEATDPLIKKTRLGDIQHRLPEWARKLDPQTDLHSMHFAKGNESVQDYISHTLDHAATIPPEKLKQYDFPRLVQEVQKVDAERAKKMAQAKIASMAGMPVHKEYPEGYKWVQLTKPGEFAQESDVMGHSVRGYEPPKGHPDYTEACGAGGCDTYGIGGWEGIKSGKAKVYSLRDPKGESHATVEVNPRGNRGFVGGDRPGADVTSALRDEWMRDVKQSKGDTTFAEWWREKNGLPINTPSVEQIKGKQNLAPKPEYQKYVQDLIRSGKYGDVKDLDNAGLQKLEANYRLAGNRFYSPTPEDIKAFKAKYGDYATQKEIDDFLDSVNNLPEPGGIPQMKSGGSVKKACKGGVTCPCMGCTKRRFAKGGAIRGALSRIAKMLGPDEVPKRLQPVQAVKEQGGQWLPGSAQEFAKYATGHTAGVKQEPYQEWAEKALPKYIEKYMGAKGDPLADVLIPHGGNTERWESLTDPIVRSMPAKVITHPGMTNAAPDWMHKLPPDTPIYNIGGMGSPSVKDYISHTLDYAATIPPEKLQQYDFPRLVKEVQKVDAERAKKMAQARVAESGLVPTHKEYPGGFRWSELRAPEGGLTPTHLERIKKQPSGEYHAVDADGKLIVSSAQNSTRAVGKTPEEAFTAGRLIEEGNIMGHCVGGYCPDVMAGKKKIYSLRDPKGESHATVEVGKGKPWNEVPGIFYDNPKLESDWGQYYSEALKERDGKNDPDIIKGFPKWLEKTNPKLYSEHAQVFSESPPLINQIKGKSNQAPKPEYQQYIQDLIRSGKYGDVRDLGNSGLKRTEQLKPSLGDVPSKEVKTALQEKYGDYVLQSEIDDYLKSLAIEPGGIPQMKSGGSVKPKCGGKLCKCMNCTKTRFRKGGRV